MGSVFNAIFGFLSQLFGAAERGASALNHLATWADEAAGTFEDTARHDRNEKLKAMMAEAGITELPKAEDRNQTSAKKLVKAREVVA